MRQCLFVLSLLCVVASALTAQTTWTGATSNAWATASNWSTAAVPTATDNVIIPDTSALPNEPTLSASCFCNALSINANGVLNGGTGTVQISGDFINNGSFVPGTASVQMVGTASATIGGSSATSINRLLVNKSSRSVVVSLGTALTLTSTAASSTIGVSPLDIQRGTLNTSGFNLSVAGRTTGAAGATTGGELLVSGGSFVLLQDVYQWSLGYFTVQSGSVTIAGRHELVNSGHRFDMSGGTVDYTYLPYSTGTTVALRLGTNNSGWGYFVNGGTINMYGSINASIGCYMLMTGTSTLNFAGSNNSVINMQSSTSTANNAWVLSNLQVSKTGGGVVDVLSTGNLGTVAAFPTSPAVSTINVVSGTLNFGGTFANTSMFWGIGSVTSQGTCNLQSVANRITGNIASSGSGTVVGATGTEVQLIGASTSSITGDNAFDLLSCTVAGRQITFGAGDTLTINGQMVLVGSTGNEIRLRSDSAGNQTMLQVNGSVVAQYCDVQDNNASSTVYAQPGGINSGNNTNWQFGGGVLVIATPGSPQAIWANNTGSGSGISSGTFTIENDAGNGVTVTDISLSATGTGDDSTAYTEVAVYIDNPSSGTQGVYESADTLFGTAAGAFPANNGTLAFSGSHAMATSAISRFFAVVKFNGSPLATGGQTFQIRVSSMTVTGGTPTGAPTQYMPGYVMNQASLNVALPTQDTRAVAASYTGPGGNGFLMKGFTITNTSPLPVSMNFLRLYGWANPSGATTAYTYVAVYADSNASGGWESATDTLIQAHTGVWNSSTFRDFAFSGGNGDFGPNETRTFLVVVKLGGSPAPAVGNTLGFYVSSSSSVNGATLTGTLQSIYYYLAIQTAGLYLEAEPGTVTQRLATDATDAQTGKFTLTNTSTGTSLNLNSITLQASGTGNDSNAYSQVALYTDTNSNGSWDGGDTLFGSAATAFASNNGTRVFTPGTALAIAGGATETFFVVTRMNGATPPSTGETFDTRVSAISSSVTNDGVGVPSAIMTGIEIIDTALVVSATTGTAAGVYANDTGTGGNGIEAGVFTITASGAGTADLLTITLAASGTGDDSTAYTEVAIYEDSATGAVGSYDNANDTLVDTAATFPADDGSLVFNVPSGLQPFSVSQAKTYFVVVKLNGTAIPAETFQYTVSGITVGTGAGSGGTPSGTMAGLDINAPDFNITDTSPATQGIAAPGGADYLMQQFEVAYPNGPDNTLTSITFTGSAISGGTLQTDIVQADLYRDDNANGTFDGADVQVDTQTGFNGSNQVIFTLSGTESQFTAGTTKVYFLMVQFDAATPSAAEYATQLTTASGASTGTNINGTPAPAAGTAPGLIYYANNLDITLNGPVASTTVNSNSQGPGGAGHVIWDGTLTTISAAWTATELEFEGTGTANANLAYDSLALYEDSNASGVYDAGDALAVAAAAVSFDASSLYLAQLTNTTFAATSSRRFFLVGTLAGSATTGQTLNARITSVTATPPAGGTVTGDVNVDSTALTIDVATITLGNGPTPPANATIDTGAAQTHVLAKFRLTASNQDVTVTQIDFTTAGTGDWINDLDPTAGVQVWTDNGDGTFDSTTDTQVFQGAGAALVAATFTPSVVVPNAGSVDLWVRLSLLATAAAGASVPETFSLSVPAASAITAGGVTALLGTPAPNSSTLSVVDFFVTTITPVADFPAGGAAITIDGNGFNAPFSVTIGGALCPGTAVINGTGTQVTGLLVPPGTGTTLPIVVTSGSLPPQTIAQTFSYSTVGSTGGGGGGDDGGGGCTAQHSGWALLLGALGLMALAGVARRRRA
ncbi:MAG: IPT/TIG domain-containing protein [Planctomycetes bacterium]|nr:IPT/TIG domain-containing protein [Planctomycetota bacterium]